LKIEIQMNNIFVKRLNLSMKNSLCRLYTLDLQNECVHRIHITLTSR